MYVGLGAYPNPYVEKLSDNAGYEMFTERTGISLSFSIGGNYYNDEVQEKFRKVFEEEYLHVLKNSPWLLARNAVLNGLQSFSLGYFTSSRLLSYLSCVCGLLVLIWLVLQRRFIWVMAIGIHSLSFTPYYPPIHAYMFGAYILIICAILISFDGEPGN